MTLLRLSIHDLRNLARVDVRPSGGLNLIHGANGSGKTSLLEAIYLLSRGRSFREGRLERVIRRGAEAVTVFADVERPGGGSVGVGVERRREGLNIRVGGRKATGLAELATLLPVLALTPASHRLLEQGPRFRRAFVDWGVFHVEQGFYPLWRRYTQALRQRNAVLREGRGELAAWNQGLSEAGEAIAALRQAYLDVLLPLIPGYLDAGSGLPGVAFSFQRGWRHGETLLENLQRGEAGDRQVGHTRQGPHRANLAVHVEGVPAHECLSRGQQKRVVAAMLLAQARLHREKTGRPCVILVDDLPAELDQAHRGVLMAHLAEVGAQTFVTGVEAQYLPTEAWPDHKMFHVEHGEVSEAPPEP